MRFVMEVVLWTFVGIGSVAAQAASPDDAVIDTLLSQSAITWDNAAWLVGRSVGTFDETTTPAQAAQKASEAGWGPKGLAPTKAIDLATYSQLVVRALNMPTGLLYKVFPDGRYAFRELIFRRVLTGSARPDALVSGERAMYFLQSAQTWKGSHP